MSNAQVQVRENINWRGTPQRCVCLCVIRALYLRGLRGASLAERVKYVVEGFNEYFDYPPSENQIVQRGDKTNRYENERPELHPVSKPYWVATEQAVMNGKISKETMALIIGKPTLELSTPEVLVPLVSVPQIRWNKFYLLSYTGASRYCAIGITGRDTVEDRLEAFAKGAPPGMGSSLFASVETAEASRLESHLKKKYAQFHEEAERYSVCPADMLHEATVWLDKNHVMHRMLAGVRRIA